MAILSIQLLLTAALSLRAAAFSDLPGHDWAAPGPGDVRSPCPGLNVLANHGYLNRSGKNLTGPALKSAIKQVYNFDDLLAGFFADGGLTVNGPPQPSINLNDLDRHNVIEHDASLSRLDFIQGNNHDIQPALVEALIADAAPEQTLSIVSLAKSRTRRDAESKAAGGEGANAPAKLRTFTYGESALILQVLGELSNDPNGELLPPVSAIQSWIGREQLPANFHPPKQQVTLFRTTSLSGKVATAANLPFTGDLLSATTAVFGSRRLTAKERRNLLAMVHGGGIEE